MNETMSLVMNSLSSKRNKMILKPYSCRMFKANLYIALSEKEKYDTSRLCQAYKRT